MNPRHVESSARRFAALGDPTRLQVFALISRSPLDLSRRSKASSLGTSSEVLALRRRCGRKPPSALRRSSMYSTSGDFSPGWKNGTLPSASWASVTGMLKRSRNRRTASSSSFLVWWVGLSDSPAGPMP